MRNFLFCLALIAILTATACKKSTNTNSSWSFEGVKYNASGAVFSSADSSLTASSSDGNSPGTLAFFFPSASISAGSYLVVNYDSLPLAANQLYIKFINSSSTFYYFSTGNDHVNATVTVSAAGRISVTVPPVYLESYSRAISDSAQLTATIKQ